jgi:aminopeptidase N
LRIGLAFFLTLGCTVIRPASPITPPGAPTPSAAPTSAPARPTAPTFSVPAPAAKTPPAPAAAPDIKRPGTPPMQPQAGEMPAQPPHGSAGGDSIGDPYTPELGNTGYQVDQYSLNLDIDLAQNQLSASAVISATATMPDLGRLSLDFKGFQVDSVSAGGESAPFYRSADKLYVDLPRAYAQDEALVLQVDYHGEMKSQTTPYFNDVKVGFNAPGADRLFVFAEPDGARAWFPANDHPLDKAALRLEATVPAGFTAVSNGDLLETRPAGERATFVWYEEDPMATYLFTLAVGRYLKIEQAFVGDVQVRHYLYQDDAEAASGLQTTPEILRFLSDLIGPYPFDEFGYVEVDAPELAMETQTMVMLDRGFLEHSDPSPVLVHEAAHQWFGDSLSLATWADIWLNEGFAEYIQVLWQVQRGDSLRLWMDRMEEAVLSAENSEFAPLNQPAQATLFGVNTYLKGAWVLHMLRQELGDEVFFKVLREYYQGLAGGHTSSADFQAAAEAVSGKDLDAFFKQWVETAGNPHLRLTWTSQPGNGGSQVTVQVCQLQEGIIYSAPLMVRFIQSVGAFDQEVIQMDQRQENLTLHLPYDPTGLKADPEQLLLADIQIEQVKSIKPCKN